MFWALLSLVTCSICYLIFSVVRTSHFAPVSSLPTLLSCRFSSISLSLALLNCIPSSVLSLLPYLFSLTSDILSSRSYPLLSPLSCVWQSIYVVCFILCGFPSLCADVISFPCAMCSILHMCICVFGLYIPGDVSLYVSVYTDIVLCIVIYLFSRLFILIALLIALERARLAKRRAAMSNA